MRYQKRVVLSLCLLLAFISACDQSYQRGLEKGLTGADETAVLSALRTITAAQRQYFAANAKFGTFDELVKSGALDQRFAGINPAIAGYSFTMSVKAGDQPSYAVNADPRPDQKGRHFYMNDSGAIHVNPSQKASATDPQL